MSGKHILDTIALLNASRNIIAKHFEIRLSQADRFTKTSSIVKAFQQRNPSSASSVQRFSQSAAGNVPRSPTQDHFNKRGEQNSVAHEEPESSLEVKQHAAEGQTLPDGTIPTSDSPINHDQGAAGSSGQFNQRGGQYETQDSLQSQHDGDLSIKGSGQSSIPDPNLKNKLSSDRAKWLQRQSESQIPAKSAQHPEVGTSGNLAADNVRDGKLPQEQETDVFYAPSEHIQTNISHLPRMKVPRHESDIQSGDPHLPSKVNSDTFYSGAEGASNDAAQEELSENQIGQIFQSPRVARLLSKKTNQVPEGVQKRGFHHSARWLKEANNEAAELKQLGEDVRRDAQTKQATLSGSQEYQMRESKVPSSRFGRIVEFGGLAASMAFGAVSETITRSGGPSGSLVLSAANMERLVAKLSKMRGAALKLGQMMSFQDSKMLPKPIHEVLQRVQDSADYMPAWQRNKVIENDLGPNWQELFRSFEEKPLAAASIGQVHGAVLANGKEVAVKVQYPGVADSISSDLNNLSLLLTASRLLPKGLYLDKTIANARTELAWECDYVREAEAAKKFRELLADEPDTFSVPEIIGEATGKQVLTMERMHGIAVTKIRDFTQGQRDWIGSQILRLCLREIAEFRYMQTDPNWTNFLYNKDTRKLELLDFGASREFPEKFVTFYMKNLDAASRKDRKEVAKYSVELGYLTGYESKAMLNAHVDSVLTLAEPFMEDAPEIYDFKDQTITDRVRALIPVMLRERLAPPPEETYSLHRKLSGAFLLCARLESRVKCRELLRQALTKIGST